MIAPTLSTNVPPVWAKVAQGIHLTPPHIINKYKIQFVDQEHIACYDLVASRRITKPKYIDFGLLGSLGLLESLNELL